LAVLADTEIRGRAFYRTMLIWPYAVAPAMAAVLWVLMFHPQIGLVGAWLNRIGIAWDYKLDGTQAMGLVILAAAWKQVSYN
ncbi:glycerol-3-phosphate transporter permease, partial [Pseudomonas aeruginosa]